MPYLNTPMPLKYIRFKQVGNRRDTIVTFPYTVPHRALMKEMGRDHVGVKSAGFVQFDEDTGEPFCYGNSEGIGVRAIEEEDTNLFKEQLGWKD